MKYEHKELIHDYLNVANRITRIEQRMRNARIEFEALNYYGGTSYDDPVGVRNRGFRVESRVSDYVDYIQMCERNIEKNKRRIHYFKRFTDTLDLHTYSSLKRRYGSINRLDDMQEAGHDEQVLDEILEIEEAISFEFGMKDNIDYLKMKQLENVELTDETVEDSFESMLELLEV